MQLRDKISQNFDYLSSEYHPTNDILHELDRMIQLDMQHSLVLSWWVQNEESISTINQLLEGLES